MRFLHLRQEKDQILQDIPYQEQIERAASLIQEADMILIGGGAGLSTAGGLTFDEKKLQDNFGDFIEKYGGPYMTTMYSAGFYPFQTEEEYWALWSRHSYINRILPPALPIYIQLLDLVKNKDHFVITTNADGQFAKAGFDKEKIFATQGDYGYMHCVAACHNKTYNAMPLLEDLKDEIVDCRIPSHLVPKCPVCGGPMEMNLRNDPDFVEDDAWHRAEENYATFLDDMGDKKVVFLELGLGYNTPMIIRFPFEKMVKDKANASLIRLNLDQATVPREFGKRAVGIPEDIAKSLNDIYEKTNEK